MSGRSPVYINKENLSNDAIILKILDILWFQA